ncbi:cellulase family glycosylhydrolase [Marinomonas transparens]|uniref:cellulase n=1 Tax=Marinomonas transparens TaxID=2795388 RepID=A0A934JVC8_9GAMM|nr:cellulase family glycosylhydrolase [Marinomonas transparens]MBJ7539046.1 cellulase family glycosylhydrolase [Marinomonas transparens]
MKDSRAKLNIHKPTWKSLFAGVVLSAMGSLSLAGEPVNGDDWLHVSGNQILDANNNPVWLTGANWFGFNTNERIFHGLWSVNLESTLDSIAGRGINLLRVPISTELIKEWKNGIYSPANANSSANPNLAGANSLQVFDAFLAHSRKIGLKVLLDMHSPKADNAGHFQPLWYQDDITAEDFYSTWEWITDRYRDDDTILAFDLENEPHGEPWGGGAFAKWDNSNDDNNWKQVCENAANRILDINPNMLVMCEGVASFPKDGVTWTSSNINDYHNNWWGGNLRGVKDYPVDLGNRQSQLLYSPHDYGPLVSQQDWFYNGFNKDTLYQDVWRDNWLYIHEDNIAPLLIGEWGGFMDGGDNEKWMNAIRDLIVEYKLHHTFWCINPNSGDTGGLLNDDWTTWDEAKYALFKPSLWSNENGKFISLDHQVALGSEATGISLGDHFGTLTTSIDITSPNDGDQVLTDTQVTIAYSLTKATSVNVYLNDALIAQGITGSASVTSPSTAGTFEVRLVGVDSNNIELPVSDSITLNAVNDVPLEPMISILAPAEGTPFETSDTINLTVSLDNASGFEAQLKGISTIFSGSTGQIQAPNEAGNYSLLVTALDENQTPTSATDSVNITVNGPATAEMSCVIGGSSVWATGFVLSPVTITNLGNETVTSWAARVDFNNVITFTSGWNGIFSADIQSVEVTSANYNGTIAPGQSVTFGFQGTHDNSFSEPSCMVY